MPAHRADLVDHKRQARDLKGRDRLNVEVPDIGVLVDRWVDHGRNIGGMVGRTVQLLDAYGATAVRQAVSEMISRGTHDIGALAILCEQKRRGVSDTRPVILDLAAQVVEREVIPHDLGGYDDRSR